MAVFDECSLSKSAERNDDSCLSCFCCQLLDNLPTIIPKRVIKKLADHKVLRRIIFYTLAIGDNTWRLYCQNHLLILSHLQKSRSITTGASQPNDLTIHPLAERFHRQLFFAILAWQNNTRSFIGCHFCLTCENHYKLYPESCTPALCV